MARSKVRIAGAVRAMRRARERLAAGLAPEEVDGFRAEMRGTVTRIEAICRQHGVRPADLPAPTRRAYDYLAALDGADLPVRPAGAGPRPGAPRRVAVRNLVAIVDRLHGEIESLADRAAGSPPVAGRPSLGELRATIRRHRDDVEGICRKQGGTPSDLPGPSRRAWQWLAWLSEGERLAEHVEAVAALMRHLAVGTNREISVRLASPAKLLRVRDDGHEILVDGHAALAVAPPEVLEAIARVVLDPDDGAARQRMREWASGPDFQAASVALDALGRPDEPRGARGAHRDLAAVFDRVNRTCFRGKLGRPHLAWSPLIAHRTLAAYEAATDTVRFSAALDDPRAPEVLLDFVMYHELLHKKLGVACSGSRRSVHPPAFRRAEKRFPRYAEAQAAMRRLGDALID